MSVLFLVCLAAGVGWAFLIGVLGPLLGGVFEHLGHLGGEDAHAGGHGHDGFHGDLLLTPLSPYVISSFLAGFGGMGLIAQKALGLGAFGSLLLASPVAFVIAAVFYYTVKALGSLTQASSEAHVTDLVGTEAEVTVPIAEGGTGEIAYYSLGSRYTAPARTEDGASADKHEKVFITRVESGIYYVRKFSGL